MKISLLLIGTAALWLASPATQAGWPWSKPVPRTHATPTGHAAMRGLQDRLEQMAQKLEAERLYARRQVVRETPLAQDALALAYSMNDVGLHYLFHGEPEQALPLFRQALALFQQHYPKGDHRLGGAYSNLAAAYRHSGDYAAATEPYLRAVRIYRARYGERHAKTGEAMNNLAAVLNQQGRSGPAEYLFRKAIHAYESSLGPDHPQLAGPVNNMAMLCTGQNRYHQAAPLFQRALQLSKRQFGLGHPRTRQILHNMAVMYARKDAHDLALRDRVATVTREARDIQPGAEGTLRKRPSWTGLSK